MRLSAITLAVLAGSALTTASAQLTEAVPATGNGFVKTTTSTNPPPGCPDYTTGVSDNSWGLTAGGFICSLVNIDCLQTIDTIEAVYGSAAFPGGVTNGNIVELGIWDDPTNDNNPSDAVLLWTSQGVNNLTVVNGSTDIYDVHNMTTLAGGPINLNGQGYIGCVVQQIAGEFPAPVDGTSTLTPNTHWLVGMTPGGGTAFDFNNMPSGNDVPPTAMESLGGGPLLLKATGQAIGAGPGVGYCFGDGTGIGCPCGNNSTLPGSGCANGAGNPTEGGTLSLTGSNSAGASGQQALMTGLTSSQPGLFFMGPNQPGGGNGLPFGDGLRCAGGAVVRIAVVFSDGAGGGSYNLQTADKPLGPINYQHWYRDPNSSPCGALFNLTNAYNVTWVP